MIPSTRDVTVTSTLEPEDTIRMGIDPLAAKHLMSILSDVYSDRQNAVIREYITNALDSHVEAGQSRPVEVVSPSLLSPTFEVQDYGVGMSKEDIRNIYALYGASTKRTTNTQTGSIGIGAKSALAYGKNFTVDAVKDGVRIVVLVSLDSDGMGTMEIISESDTNKPNGVKISIPVSNEINDFKNKLRHFHRFVEPGKLLVDGKDAERPDMMQLSDHLWTQEDSGWNKSDYIVMGNIGYPIDSNHFQQFHGSFSVVARVEMGEIDFTPSREHLNYNHKTREVLDRLRSEFSANLQKYLQEQVDACANKREAFNKLNKTIRRQATTNNFTYNGASVPLHTDFMKMVSWSYGRCSTVDNNRLSQISEDDVFVTGFNVTKFTKVHTRKLNKYLESIGKSFVYRVHLLPDTFDQQGLFDDVDIINYDDIKSVKIESDAVRNKVRQYEGIAGSRSIDRRTPDTNKNIWYASKSELRQDGNDKSWLQRAYAFIDLPHDEFYFVAESQQAKFKETYPSAKHYLEYFKEQVNDFIDGLTDEEKICLSYQEGLENAEFLHGPELEDPELVRVIDIRTKESRALFARKQTLINTISTLQYGLAQELLKLLPQSDGTARLNEKYPLLRYGAFYRAGQEASLLVRKHLVDYCNMVYRAAKLEETNTEEGA